LTDLRNELQKALATSYALERELGRGGMATVFLAQDLRHDRPVALKVLHPDLARMLGAERFQREIKLAARLQHPHILTVHDSGETAGQLWFTMPYVEGESLRDRLGREKQLPVEAALRIAIEAARALEYAHRHGVVHRDIKPENLLLTTDGSTLVADFGIARALAEGDERLTETGLAIGTPAYMSPEQASGDKALDGRTDVYSLGAVLYEMLAGEPPFTGPTVQAVIAKRFSGEIPRVRQARPSVPEAVDQAIQQALAPVPADRFATVAEFAQALQGAGRSPTSTAPVSTPAPIPSPSVTGPSVPAVPRRRAPLVAYALVLGFILGLGVLFAWRRDHADAGTRVRILAVLPFENLGDSSDAYFADGVADEVRTKLAQVAGLEVIARGSSIEYRRTTKRPADIARELGADYLLTGTVRWDKAGGTSRVRVTPELVDARTGQAAHSRWGQQFDAAMTDVFQVQADIATKVVDALGVALADSARQALAVKPTENLAAYDEYLQGEAASQAMTASDLPSLRRAIAFYERAVALDSTFALAWAKLSRARSSLYGNGVPDPALGDQARLAAERARALRPREPTVYQALGDYYGSVNPVDNNRSLAQYEEGLRIAPDNVELLGTAALTEWTVGRWDSVSTRLARAALLDPRSANTARRLAVTQLYLRNYRAADSAADRAVALAPTNPRMILYKVMNCLAQGNLAEARGLISGAEARIDVTVLLQYMANFNDLYWALDDAEQRRVLEMRPGDFDDDRGAWGMVRAGLYHLRGDHPRMLVYADSARLALEEQIRANPEDPQRHSLRGLTLAYLGRKAEAIREGQRGVEIAPVSRDAYIGPYLQLQLVRIYLVVGEPEQALDQLEPLLHMPFYLSPGWLRVDPNFAPLKRNPRFERLVAGAP
jgi:serine/threonine-protein kinase